MAAFRLLKEGKEWFKHLSGARVFDVDFDMFYLFMLAGLAVGRKAEGRAEETAELIDYFPKDYANHAAVILGTFISRELRGMGVALDDRAAVALAMKRWLDPRSPSRLSDDAVKELNQYGYGGVAVLMEWFDEKPRSALAFLTRYRELVVDALGTRSKS